MPEVRRYFVTQTREVEVTANSPTDAILIAAAAFEHGQDANGGVTFGKAPEGVWGNTSSRVREIEMLVKERR